MLSMLMRLHRFGIIQNSMSCRNILVQPGPLTLPPSSRSMDRPSFRIIDFGRAVHTESKKQKMHWIQTAYAEEDFLAKELGRSWFHKSLLWPNEHEDDPEFRY
jgi:hypothetical protein